MLGRLSKRSIIQKNDNLHNELQEELRKIYVEPQSQNEPIVAPTIDTKILEETNIEELEQLISEHNENIRKLQEEMRDYAGTNISTSIESMSPTDMLTTGTNNFETTGNDGGSEGLETIEGGKVDTESGEGGAQEGETSVASGGGGISLGDVTVSVSVDIQETEDANWNRTPYTSNTDLNIKVTGNQGAHQHYIDGRVASVTPLASQDYKHTHYFTESGGQSLAYTQYGGGTHSHEAYVDNGEDDGHHHDIPRWTLKHTHPINASGSGSVTVNNTEGSGQTGFSHSHNFKIKAHTHNFSVPDHTHTFNLPNHQHTFNLPNHKHTFNLPNHTHTFDLPNHTHTIEIGQHNHDIVPGIFESGNPTGFTIKVSGTAKATINATSYDNDIVTWLLDSKNQVPRDTWIDVEIIPNDLAYCQCSVFVQGFVQSRGGGNF